MNKLTIIGPGREGNFLVGYYRPTYGAPQFMPLADCNTRSSADSALERFEAEAKQRRTLVRGEMQSLGIRGFYADNE